MKKYFCFLILIAFASCRKYVEIDQIGKKTLKNTADFRNVMNDNNTLEYGYGLCLFSGDDLTITDVTRINSMLDYQRNTYTWAAKYYTEAQSDADWDRNYKVIYVCNEILNGVLTSENGTDKDKNQIYGEALVHRAYAYLNLVNIYAKQYDAGTASTDLGVPLLLSPDLYANLTRASVQRVYDQITGDLLASVSMLPATPDYNVRPAKVSAYALLARTYLNTRDFVKAGAYADSALKLQNTLLDLNSYVTGGVTYPLRLVNPEVMLSKLVTGSYTAMSLSDKLLQTLGTKDLRYQFFTKPGSSFSGSFSAAFTGRAYWGYRITNEGILIGPDVPEMMLIKAEAAARAGDASAAMSVVNSLRQKRFSATDYTALTAANAADALVKVAEERQRELFGRGFRWFDQRRYSKDNNTLLVSTVTRTFNNVTYTLEPGSNRYTFPIGDKYILLNPEIQQNER